MSGKVRCYLASGWFSKYQDHVETRLYNALKSMPNVDLYSPRRDGVKLTPGEFHDHEKRKRVFQDNVDNILSSDVVVANVDPYEGYLDTGTVWEVGFALQNDVPVILYIDAEDKSFEGKTDYNTSLEPYFGKSIENKVIATVTSLEELEATLSRLTPRKKFYHVYLVGPSQTDEHRRMMEKVREELSNLEDVLIIHADKKNFVAFEDPYLVLENDIRDSDLVVACIDDRDSFVSLVMGMAYAQNKPIVSFTNHNYGVNLMLLLCLVKHCMNLDELKEAIENIKKHGPEFYGEQRYDNIRVI